MIKNIILLFVSLFLLSCSCKKSFQNNKRDSAVEKIGIQSYGKGYKVSYNPTKEYALVYNTKEVKLNDPFPTLFYSVVELKNNKVIFKDIVVGGKIKWISDFELELRSLVNRPKDILHSTSNVIYKLNVKSLKKHK